MSSTLSALLHHPGFLIRQRTESAELFGIEGANVYDILDVHGRPAFIARERVGGFWQQLGRQLGGHATNEFVVDVLDHAGRPLMTLAHPVAWWMQRIEVRSGSGRLVGTFEQCFTWLDKKMVIKSADGRTRMQMDSDLFTPWQHSFTTVMPPYGAVRVAHVEKTWDGCARELFTDADTFRLTYARQLGMEERAFLLGAALFIDLVWFERKAGS